MLFRSDSAPPSATSAPPDDAGRWQLRLWWKPLVTLIWFGGALVALGGALSMLGHILRERRAARRAHEAAFQWSAGE